MSRHSLIWSVPDVGTVELSAAAALPHADGWSVQVLADGFGFGNAEPIMSVVRSLLSDGELTRTTSYGNRITPPIQVQVSGPDSIARDAGVRLLSLMSGRPGTLTWVPPDGLLEPRVFQVQTSVFAAAEYDDMLEMAANALQFSLQFTCLPFPRAEQPTVTEFDAVPAPSTTLVNDATSLSGWSGEYQDSFDAWVAVTPSVGGTPTRVLVSGPTGSPGLRGVRLTLTQTFTVPADRRYLRAPLYWSGAPFNQQLVATIGGVDTVAPLVASGPTGDGGLGFGVWLLPVGTVTKLRWSTRGDEWGTRIDIGRLELGSTPALPTTTRRQRLMVAEVGGSARAPVSLKVARPSGTGPLGSVMLYADTASGPYYTPDTRRFRTSTTGRVADSSTISGYRESLTWSDSPHSFQCNLPSSLYDGTYTVIARVGRTSAGTIDEVLIRADFGPDYSRGVLKVLPMAGSGTATPHWMWVVLGSVELPLRKAAPLSPDSFNFHVSARDVNTSGDPGVQIDDVWLCHHEADLTLLEMPAEETLWINEPSPTDPFGSLWVSPNGDLANAYAPTTLLAQGRMRVAPPESMLFVATSGVDDAKVTATHHEHYLH